MTSVVAICTGAKAMAEGFLRVGQLDSGPPKDTASDGWVPTSSIDWTVSEKGVKHGVLVITEDEEAIDLGLLLPEKEELEANGDAGKNSKKLRKIGRLNYRAMEDGEFVKIWKFYNVFVERRRATGTDGAEHKIRFAYRMR